MNSVGIAKIPIARDRALFPSTLLAQLRVAICYLIRHQRMADLGAPTTFTELVQRRKLESRDHRMVMFADKLAVKSFVTEKLGKEWVVPTLWQGTDLPKAPQWPLPFVLKSRHGCNQNAFFRDSSDDWQAAHRVAQRWLKQPYGRWLDEWLYAHIPRGLIVEPFVGEAGVLPIDYKIYTFNGHATHIQVHLDRESQHRWMLFDRDWRRVSAPTQDPDPVRPQSLNDILAASEKLGAGFNFVRSDFYEVGGQPLFSEMTFYPGSGLDKFNPISLDALLGEYWLLAGGR